MILKRRVALNGKQLDSIDKRIVISGVEPGNGKENFSATNSANGFGSRVTSQYRTMLDIVVKFMLLERGRSVTGMTERSKLLEQVNEWAANGGVLTVNYKPKRRLNVILVQAPGEGSLWDFSKEFSLTFRAYDIPYWEDEDANIKSFGGTSPSGSSSIGVEGSVKTQCDVEVRNVSGMTINRVAATVDGNQMSFTNLALAANETLVIDHDKGLVRIRIRNTSGGYRNAMAKRTGANDMTARPGTRSCSYSCERACSMTVRWRSRYL